MLLSFAGLHCQEAVLKVENFVNFNFSGRVAVSCGLGWLMQIASLPARLMGPAEEGTSASVAHR